MTVQPFDFTSNPFGSRISIPGTARFVFVSDMFVEDYVGGAELTTEAIVQACPAEVFKLRSKDVTMELLKEGADRFWIFGNFCAMNANLIPSIVGNLSYCIVEYDYKYCRARSPEKHAVATGSPCDCSEQVNGKTVSALFYGSRGIFWMSELQKQRYLQLFPFLAEKDGIVLSSVFEPRTLGFLAQLREKHKNTSREGWIVLGSDSWIKGYDAALRWCADNGKRAEVVWNLPYEALLERMAMAEGFVYLPPGGDTCPRMVIEAKLLGCKLELNDNVQHKDEAWFATDDLQSIQDYLFTAPSLFWKAAKEMSEHRTTISGYTTTYNAVKQGYPFQQCIQSMLAFCDEVCIADGGSTDATLERLAALAYPKGDGMTAMDVAACAALTIAAGDGFWDFPEDWHGIPRDPRIRVRVIPRDWKSKRHPIFDGMQKAEARALCTKEFCWQMDSDEVVHEDDAPRIAGLCRSVPRNVDVLALPVIEYWGGPDKVRMDVTPWKWRLSRNLPHITHGIPGDLRVHDADGVYAREGTDGCDLIHDETLERIPFVSFYPPQAEQFRRLALLGDEQARQEYQSWFNQATTGLPSVFHYSWYDLPRKIRLYRDYWQNHWNALWDKDTSDTAANNLMFGIPWSEVTDEMIEHRAQEMKIKLGGWIWHRAWDGKATTPHITSARSQPRVMQ